MPIPDPGADGQNGMFIVGDLSPSASGILYPTGEENDAYRILTEGLIGTTTTSANSKYLLPDDILYCVADNAGGNESTVGTSWIVIRGNQNDFKKHHTISRNNISNIRGAHTIVNSGSAANNLLVGFNNTVATSGNSNFIAGSGNIVTGNTNFVAGVTNQVTAGETFVAGGSGNILDGDSSSVLGTNNDLGTGTHNLVAGTEHIVDDATNNVTMFGRYGRTAISDTLVHSGAYLTVGFPETGQNQHYWIAVGASTGDAVATVLKTQGNIDLIAFATKTSFELEGEIMVVNPSTNDLCKLKFFACGHNKTGTAVLDTVYFVDSTGAAIVQGGGPYATPRATDVAMDPAGTTLDLRLVVSSNEVNIEITGLAATTLFWGGQIHVTQIGWY